MDSVSVEDIRKKRDSTDASIKDEKPKKLRANRPKSSNSTAKAAVAQSYFSLGDSYLGGVGNVGTEGRKVTTPLDLESALHHVVQIGDGVKEYVSNDAWISFRVGHAGDASVLATCFRYPVEVTQPDDLLPGSCEKKSTATTSSEDTSLEVRLADGLGDEDTPPSIFALLVDIHFNDHEPRVGAAALFSIAWEEASRILLVERLHVDSQNQDIASVIKRRVWLRLCTLSMLTSCDEVVSRECGDTRDT